MFLERLGKFCFSQMRPSFFFFLLLIPIFFAAGYLMVQNARLAEAEERFSGACRKGRIALERKEKKERFLKRYSNADPYFIDQRIESLSFLEKERKELAALLEHPALADKHSTEARLRFLSSDENRLAFTEEAIRTSSLLKETEEKQRHPVQMDEEDVKRLLSLLEDLSIDSFSPLGNSPQIIITDFLLEKKETPLKTKVLEVNTKLLKREWIQ